MDQAWWRLAVGTGQTETWLASNSFLHCILHLSASQKLAIILDYQGRSAREHGVKSAQGCMTSVIDGQWQNWAFLSLETCSLWDVSGISWHRHLWASPIYNHLLTLLFLPLRNSLNLSTVSLPSLCVLQAAFLHSCVDIPPTGCPISAHVHCICSIHGRDPTSIVQTLFLCSYSLVTSHLIQSETQSPWIGYSLYGHPFSCLSLLASPECCGQVLPSSFLSNLSGILVLRALHGLSLTSFKSLGTCLCFNKSHFLANVMISLFFMAEKFLFCIHSCVDGFHFIAIVESAAVSVNVCVSLWTIYIEPLGYC